MAIWKEQSTAPAATPERITPATASASAVEPSSPAPAPAAARAAVRAVERESVIAPELTIEGKIEGSGNVRIAGKFKGDVNINGNLTIETNASLTGQVTAKAITIAGELNGNVLGADKVDLLESGVVNGDIKAGMLTVAAGSRMRGQLDFGWKDKG
ncbi:MAG: polymer-forming cytoskeletal protein [Steroidobacteraceae bacterium]|nr:polymer-forming cytoskeletal protein [Nevskiaceae bacterium]